MRTTKTMRLLLFVTVPLVVAGFAVANTTTIKKWFIRQPETVNVADNNQKDPVQEALMNEMMAWLKPFDSTNTSYYLNGFLTAVDKSDSANAMIDIPYTVCRDGKQLYLRIGQTETINNNEHYFFIDHGAHKMLLSGPREITQSPGLPVNELYNYIKSEGFSFSKTTVNSRATTITLQNPAHISYKELSVQYDSVAKKVSKIFMRQADVTDPLNADKEKWVTLVVKDWKDDPDPKQYLGLQQFIQKKQQEWVPASAYEAYELIKQ